MKFRFAGLVPAIALLAAGAAHAQTSTTGGGGSMAYPDPLPSGEIKIPAPTARDTGSMAYPTSPGGVTEGAPTARDTGSMAVPAASGGFTKSVPGRASAKAKPVTTAAATPAMPDTMPSPAGMKAARELAVAPGAAPVPYVDFGAAPATGHAAMEHKAMHSMAKKVSAETKPATAK